MPSINRWYAQKTVTKLTAQQALKTYRDSLRKYEGKSEGNQQPNQQFQYNVDDFQIQEIPSSFGDSTYAAIATYNFPADFGLDLDVDFGEFTVASATESFETQPIYETQNEANAAAKAGLLEKLQTNYPPPSNVLAQNASPWYVADANITAASPGEGGNAPRVALLDNSFGKAQFEQLFDIPQGQNSDEVGGEFYNINVTYPHKTVLDLWSVNIYDDRDFFYELDNGFAGLLAADAMKRFFEFEQEKIEKVGQYLRGNTSLELPALERELVTINVYEGGGGTPAVKEDFTNWEVTAEADTTENVSSRGEGDILRRFIKAQAQILITGATYTSTGATDAGATVSFQTMLIIKNKVLEGPIPAQFGVTPLALQEIRDIACSPKVAKKRKEKPDDEKAAANKKKKKTAKDRNRSKLSASQKQEISAQVRSRIEQVGDAAFLNALIRAGDIETTEQVFDFVLNVLPLGQIIEIAIDCAKKFLRERTPDETICDVIMKDLSDEDFQRVLQYANVNASTDAIAARFKRDIIDKFDGSFDDPSGLKDLFIREYNENVGTREVICAMVFAAVPAAITLLALYIKQDTSFISPDGTCGDSLTPIENEIKTTLENPVKQVLEEVERGLMSHPVLSFTQGLVDNLINQLVLFVNQILVESVTLLLQEVAHMCDGSSKSDFANAPAEVVPFNPNLDDLITDPGVYDDLADYIDGEEPEGEASDKNLIKDFFEDLADLLTLSELCVLFGGDPNSLNYNFIIDKIFYGILSLEKYSPLKKLLNTKEKLIDFLDVFGESFDAARCNDRIEELINTKKVLSELCSSSNDSLVVNDLGQKLSDNAIANLLEQEDEIFNNLMNAIKNLTSPETPAIFCGPDATAQGKTPLVGSSLEPSVLHVGKQTLKSTLSGVEAIFESELAGFVSLLVNGGVDFNNAAVNKIFGAGSEVSKVLSQTYSFKGSAADTLNDNYGGLDVESRIKQIAISNSTIAKDINNFFTGVQSDLNVGVEQLNGGPVISVSYNSDYIIGTQNPVNPFYYILNFSNEEYSLAAALQMTEESEEYLVPAGQAKLVYFNPGNPPVTYSSTLSEPLSNTIFDLDYFSGEYSNLIYNAISSPEFFAFTLEQIIREHAEYITTADLFQLQNFVKLRLTKQNTCDDSLFFYQDIIDKLEERSKKVECVTGFGKIPTPIERVQTYSIFEAIIRVITLNEMMKSFFVFSSFGMEALLPRGDVLDSIPGATSFYFNYLISEIQQRIEQLGIADGQIQDIAPQVYAAEYGLDENNVSLGDAYKAMIQESVRKVQNILAKKLEKSGINTKLINLDSLTQPQGAFEQEFAGITESMIGTQYGTYSQALDNIITKNTAANSRGCFSPPEVERVDFSKKMIHTKTNLYSTNTRLQNGGFFIEKGLEVIHNRPGNDSPESFSIFSLDKLISALPFISQNTIQVFLDFYHQGASAEPNNPPGVGQNIYDILKGQVTAVGGDSIVQDYIFGAEKVSPSNPTNFTKVASIYDVSTQSSNQNQGGFVPIGSLFPILGPEDFLGHPSKTTLQDGVDFIRRQGRIAIDSSDAAYSLYKDLANNLTIFINRFIKGLEVTKDSYGDAYILEKLKDIYPEEVSANAIINRIKIDLASIKKYFKHFRSYKTLYLLIRISNQDEDNIFFANFYNNILQLDLDNSDSGVSSFIDAALERKFFIKEPNGTIYFKLPLHSIYGDTPVTRGLADTPVLQERISSVFTDIENYSAYNPQNLAVFSQSPQFKRIIDSLEYRDILSFISITVTELFDAKYATIDNLFSKTLLTLRAALQNMSILADRVNNPNVYAQNPDFDELNRPSQAEQNLGWEFVKGIIFMVANMSDPTWQTPWFLPGPLTPFGIIAKILEGQDDGEEDLNEAAKKLKPTPEDTQIKCPDDVITNPILAAAISTGEATITASAAILAGGITPTSTANTQAANIIGPQATLSIPGISSPLQGLDET